MNNDELKQKASITNKDIKTNLKQLGSKGKSLGKLISFIIRVPITIKENGMIIDM